MLMLDGQVTGTRKGSWQNKKILLRLQRNNFRLTVFTIQLYSTNLQICSRKEIATLKVLLYVPSLLSCGALKVSRFWPWAVPICQNEREIRRVDLSI